MEKTVQKSKLLYRKYTHVVGFYGKRVLQLVWYYIAKFFYFLFPKARHAFKKRDKMAGLTHGPSSFFLHKISEGKKARPGTRGVAKKRKAVLE